MKKYNNIFGICILINCFFYILKLIVFDNFGLSSIGRFLNIEVYQDCLIYEKWVIQLKEGLLLYKEIDYQYTPLFVYILTVFSYIPFRLSFTIPIFLSNMVSGYWINKIAKTLWLKSKNITLFYYLNPFTLLYGSFCLFSNCVFILFSVIAFYYFIEQKYKLAYVFIGISVMIKQYALFQLFIMIVVQIRDKEYLEVVKGMIICYFIFLLVSCYWLITDFDMYINKITWNIFNRIQNEVGSVSNEGFIMEYNLGVNFLTFFKWIGCNNIVLEFLYRKYIIFGIAILIIIYLVIKKVNLIELMVIGLTILYLTFPKGISKYYLLGVIPFLALGIKQYIYNTQFLMVIVFMFRPLYFLIIFIGLFKYRKMKIQLSWLKQQYGLVPVCMVIMSIILCSLLIILNKDLTFHIIFMGLLGCFIFNIYFYHPYSIENSEL